MKFRAAAAMACALLALAACGSSAQSAKDGDPKEQAGKAGIDGYGDLKFGMSLAEATRLVPPSTFHPVGMKQCLLNIAVRGCLLSSDNNLDAYTSRDGVPYTIGLAFNRFDKLTDVELKYDRRMMDDPDEKMSLEDCRAITDRTVDWLVADYGPFDKETKVQDADKLDIVKTTKGNTYRAFNGPDSLLVTEKKVLPDKRVVSFFSHYMVMDGETGCAISAGFGEPESVERWSLPPESQKILDDIKKQVKETE